MKLCESWLHVWVKNQLSPKEIIDRFTMAGLEVGDFYKAAPDFENVVVAEVVECKRHPQADKLSICQVNNGQEIVQIVCGASNVREGLKVALAKPGAKLPNGIKISEAKLRGEPSFGMLCSEVELGCAETSDGIWELPKDAPVGMNFREYLDLDEWIYEFELTPNRGDCFSARGLARELAALTNVSFENINTPNVNEAHEEIIPVTVEDDVLCPKYCGRYIKGIQPHAITPNWLREKIRRIGLRSVHPVVDVLNYTMFYLGQPLHAFDLHKIKRDIHVRRAGIEESIHLLNGKTVVLESGTPVIADSQGPIAIAGVMGSESSAVDDDTVDVFLESAFFNPVAMAGVARRYGLSTDASMRFERGVDPLLAQEAIEFATALLVSIAGGTPGPVQVCENAAHLPKQVEIIFNPKNFQKRTGVDLSLDQMQSILERLHFTVNVQEKLWEVAVPSYRFDIHQEVDLIEEILRIYGYSNIPSIPLEGQLRTGHIALNERIQRQASQFLKSLGYLEAISYAFVDPKLQEIIYPKEKTINLMNPISPELAQMRLGLWPGLIAALVHNTNRQQQSLQLFEAGVSFNGGLESLQENFCLSGLIYGEKGYLNWCSPKSSYDFFDAKGHIEHLLAQLGHNDIEFKVLQDEALHPAQAASIWIAGVECGQVGALHPKWQQILDLPYAVFLWNLNLALLPAVHSKKYSVISKFPQTRRDLSFVVAQTVQVGDIVRTIFKMIPRAILKDVQVFDVYQGKGIPEGFISLAVAMIFQDPEKTLVESDIQTYQDAVLTQLKQDFDIKLRDGQ